MNDFKKLVDKQTNQIKEEHEEDDFDWNTAGKKVSDTKNFIFTHIKTNYLKNNLYEFIQYCKKLDSVPTWRRLISQLIVTYIRAYVKDPNTKKNINVIPSYDYFNLVLMGTPGVGKSYTADLVGQALKWSGFLTVGDRKDIKKPDIVGSYTGQTAPKVYNELTQCLGKVVFIDEAYSIAGAKDQVKGTFNEFGQEALDAITDYTSEHIGLLGFIVAGYEYEMKTQFLNVNIGLPRRFPTVLTLHRYNMNTFWKILEGYINKFCYKEAVENHHKACFELLNIMFNFQCDPNPRLKMSTNWEDIWKRGELKNIFVNLQLKKSALKSEDEDEDKLLNIKLFELTEFDKKINVSIESNNIEFSSQFNKYLANGASLTTKTFIRAFIIWKFCDILNGDFFRSQADNLTKFSQTIL